MKLKILTHLGFVEPFGSMGFGVWHLMPINGLVSLSNYLHGLPSESFLCEVHRGMKVKLQLKLEHTC